MLKINKKVEYALISLKYILDKGGERLVSAREICDAFNTPFDTTAKVMQLMNGHGILKSVKGIKGGYALEKSLESISYMQLVRLIEGKEEIGRTCITNKGTCDLINKCNIISPLEQLHANLNLYLETLTLHDLLNGKQKRTL